MNKKQRNRKIVAQNNRNRLINRRYTSTIKTLSKIFWKKIKEKKQKKESQLKGWRRWAVKVFAEKILPQKTYCL